jgi:hypothetical protein
MAGTPDLAMRATLRGIGGGRSAPSRKAPTSVGYAHRFSDRLEARIREVINGAAVTIKDEPPEKSKQHGAVAVP